MKICMKPRDCTALATELGMRCSAKLRNVSAHARTLTTRTTRSSEAPEQVMLELLVTKVRLVFKVTGYYWCNR